MRFIALRLSSLLLATVATARGQGIPPRNDQDLPAPVREPASRILPSSFAPLALFARDRWTSRPTSPLGQATGNPFLVVRSSSGEIETPDQLLAALGMSRLSIRVTSWPAAGRGAKRGQTVEGSFKVAVNRLVFIRFDCVDRDDYELVKKRPLREGVVSERMSVNAGTLGFVHDVKMARPGSEIGFGGDVTLYRFDSRFDPIGARHPLSVHGFFRVRFGSRADTSRSIPVGHSMGM